MNRQVEVRAVAQRDLAAAVRYLAVHAGTDTAQTFVDDFEAALETLRGQPAVGSPRFATEVDIPGLRTWGLSGFPYLIFYRFDERRIDLWRVLHTRRDIPGSLVEAQDA